MFHVFFKSAIEYDGSKIAWLHNKEELIYQEQRIADITLGENFNIFFLILIFFNHFSVLVMGIGYPYLITQKINKINLF